MCLAVPAKVIAIGADGMATVSLADARRQVALDLVPDAKVGDYVIVHVGFAIQRLDESEAQRTLEYFDALLRADSERAEAAPAQSDGPARGFSGFAGLILALLLVGASARCDDKPKADLKPRRADRAGIQWRSSWSLAAAQSSKTGRPVLALFGARWCRFCKLMDESTLGEPAVVALVNSAFLAVRVDVDVEPALVEHYQTERTPTFLVIRPNGAVAARLVGYRDGPTLVQELRRTLAELAAAPLPSGSAALLREFEAAELLFKRGKFALAYAAYARLAGLDSQFAEAEQARRRLAEIEKRAAAELAEAKKAIETDAFAEAVSKLDRVMGQFAGSDSAALAKKLKDELLQRPQAKALVRRAAAERLFDQAMNDLERDDFGAALARFETIVKEYPDERVAGDARAELARLRQDAAVLRKANDQAAAGQSTVWLSMARTWKANGRLDRARVYYEKVRTTFPGTTFAEQAAKELAQGSAAP